jgi:hypothetical protein
LLRQSSGGLFSVAFKQFIVYQFLFTYMGRRFSSLVFRLSQLLRALAIGLIISVLGYMPLPPQAVLFFLRLISPMKVDPISRFVLIAGGAPVTAWVYRACVIQGTQQIFAAGLWYWGHQLATLSAAGMLQTTNLTTSSIVTAVTWPIAVALIGIGVCLFLGLPDYYRQLPGRIPAFYQSVTRRKLILVFLTINYHSANGSGFSLLLFCRISG